jgi:hypothetical protein
MERLLERESSAGWANLEDLVWEREWERTRERVRRLDVEDMERVGRRVFGDEGVRCSIVGRGRGVVEGLNDVEDLLEGFWIGG